MKYTYTKVKNKEAIEWYKTKSGKKLYRVRFKRKINGKNIPYTKNGFKTIAEAVAGRDHAISQINKTNGLNNEKMTVSEYWKIYRKNKIESHNWTADTVRGADYQMEFNILPQYQNTPLSKITRDKYQSFINYLLYDRTDPRHPEKKKPLAKSSVKTLNRIMQSLMNSAVLDEKIDHNPLQKITIKKDEKAKKKALTVEESEKVLTYFKQHTSKLRFAMLYLPILGMRRGEIMGIKYGAPKPVRGGYLLPITKTRTISEPNGKGTKNDSSNRTLFIGGEAAHQLTIALREFERVMREHNRIPNKDDFIFVEEDTGNVMNVNTMTNMYHEFGKKMGILPLHPHMFRHTVATINAIKGVDRELTAQFLGHKNVEMTDYYNEPTVAGKKVVMSVIDDSFSDINHKLESGVNQV
ncbi:tyrosine-type recombinase/integrase [Loigolactobacillus coryniformis]|uniref:Integrase family protein n=1 Tax=Loigolactobacillus coryniformis subsp. coryniformis CECT 5711 TaxID=1185325 RepID=J2ZTU7_9LACO|nr:site-specific integrase [Loigolactobacillus coryniformis]EJN56391.1 Integrase family protein [Loigolactobacillus coryniformis subsp. coryniformis CECT 5711]